MISGPIKTQLDDLHTLELNKATRLKTAPTRRVFPEGNDAKGRPYEDFGEYLREHHQAMLGDARQSKRFHEQMFHAVRELFQVRC